MPLGADDLAPLGQSFDAELLRDLPGAHRMWTVLEIADAAAIVEEIENGGLYTGQPLRFSAHGASWTQASFALEGLDVTDPWGGTPLLVPDLHALATLDLVTGAAPASVGGAGPQLDFGLLRPGRAWGGSLVLDAGGAQDAAGAPPAVARYESLRHARFDVHGPVAERVSLFVAGARRRAERVERGTAGTLEGEERSLLAQLVWTPNDTDERRFLAVVQDAAHPYAGRARVAGPARQDDRFLGLQAAWTRRHAWTARLGYARGSFSPQLGPAAGTAVVERLLDGPVTLLFDGKSTRERWSAAGSWSKKSVELGLEGSWARSTTQGARGLAAETVDGNAARVWDYGWTSTPSRVSTLDGAAWLRDRFRYRASSVDAGLRLESTRAGDVRWTRLLPRLSSRLGGRRLALRLGYAEYRHRLPHFLLAYGDPAARQGDVYRWDDANGDGRFTAAEQGPLVARVGPGGATSSIDPALRAPTTREITAGLESTLADGWTAILVAVSRRESHLVGEIESGATYDVTLVPDPNKDLLGPEDDHLLPIFDRRPESFGQDRVRLTNVDGSMLHEGVELLVRGRVGERLRLALAGTASRSEGNAASPGFRVTENDQGALAGRLSPNAAVSERGRMFSDRAYTLNLLGTFRTPWDMRVGAAARYQDGQPYSRIVVAEGLRQGAEPVQAQPERSRFEFTFTLDARVEQGISVGRGRLAAAVEVLNLLGTSHETEEDVVTGPAYRTPAFVQPPRAVIVELRADF